MAVTPLIIKVEQKGSSQIYGFDASPVRIGRSPLNDLPIDEGYVSQWHAIVRFDAKGTRYFDLGSTNGTTIDGKRVEKNAPVDITDASDVKIGPIKLVVSRGPMPATGVKSYSFAQKGGAEQIKRTVQLGASFATSSSNAVATTKKIYGAVTTQRDMYDAWRLSWKSLHESILRGLDEVGDEHRGLTLGGILQAYPEIANEPQFRDLAHKLNVPIAGGTVNAAAAASEMLAGLSQHYAPKVQAPASSAQLEKFLDRIAMLLDAYTRSYVELRKGYQQFGTEMAVRHAGETSPVERARDSAEVLAYLMDWTVDGQPRVRELVSSFADLMIHQVALLNGLMEGVRSLVRRFDPNDIVKQADPKAGFFEKLFPDGNRWRHFVQHYRAATEDDRAITTQVFGHEFARAYSLAAGDRFDESAQKLLPAQAPQRTGSMPAQPDVIK
ncbi:MAG: FHA domain-containing protein [Deltaproteobacteria bacterium]|nr:FHA domain-containing protein [Deltaproteobacteria bacterium]